MYKVHWSSIKQPWQIFNTYYSCHISADPKSTAANTCWFTAWMKWFISRNFLKNILIAYWRLSYREQSYSSCPCNQAVLTTIICFSLFSVKSNCQIHKSTFANKNLSSVHWLTALSFSPWSLWLNYLSSHCIPCLSPDLFFRINTLCTCSCQLGPGWLDLWCISCNDVIPIDIRPPLITCSSCSLIWILQWKGGWDGFCRGKVTASNIWALHYIIAAKTQFILISSWKCWHKPFREGLIS